MKPGGSAVLIGLGVSAFLFLLSHVVLDPVGDSTGARLVFVLVCGVVAGVLVYFPARQRARFSRAIDAIEAIDDVDQRLLEGDAGETGRLATALNHLLARLEEAESREQQFLASASHELRRPLAALRGELELAVRRRRSAADLRAAIELALDDAQDMSRLTDDLLFHARDQAGRLTPDDELIDLTDLIYDAVGKSQRSMPRMPTLHVGNLPDLDIRGDENGLARVLENLIVNAGKHAGAEAFITVEASVEATALVIHITDDGPGVPEEEQATLFDAFARGDRARAVGGSGLGLAIARSWVRAHGGDLQLLSPVHAGPRPGARFSIRLPAERIVDSAMPELEEPTT